MIEFLSMETKQLFFNVGLKVKRIDKKEKFRYFQKNPKKPLTLQEDLSIIRVQEHWDPLRV